MWRNDPNVCAALTSVLASARAWFLRRYLLEKVRLIKQNEGERNFHVLYQLCKGSSAEEAAVWQLPPMAALHYLNQSGCYELSSDADASEFIGMRKALRVRLLQLIVYQEAVSFEFACQLH